MKEELIKELSGILETLAKADKQLDLIKTIHVITTLVACLQTAEAMREEEFTPDMLALLAVDPVTVKFTILALIAAVSSVVDDRLSR